MMTNTKESDSILILYKLGNADAINGYLEYVKSNLKNTIVYYYSNSCTSDQSKILEFLDTKKIKAIVNIDAVSLVMDVNFLTKIKSNYEVKLICWHADISEYFDTYLVYVSQLYDMLILDEWTEIQRYKNYGFNAKWFSHGYDLKYVKDSNSSRDIDVAFVGRMDRPGRKELYSKLSKTNLNISFFGYGSKNGYISSEKMMELYSKSKIVLNLTSISTVVPHFDTHRSINSLLSQVKGRIYEGGIAGAMILTEPASSLPFYGKNGESFVVFNSSDDLIKVVDFYIKNEKERLLIAKKGFENSLKYGTYKSQTEYLKSLIKQTSISSVGTIYLDSVYHVFVSRLIVDNYLRSFLGFKKPDFSVLKGKRVDFLIYAFFRALFLYPYKIYNRIKN